MKRLFGVLICLMPLFSLAGNGDTTHVRSHDRVHMNWYGNFDRKIYFPTAGKTFQRVKMHYTLGCPDNGCSDWDYTVQAFLRQPTGVKDSIINLELGRLITPYAADKTKTWTFTYTYDITEFALLLKDSVTIRSHFSGYQDGFTCTIDFEFIEGEPALNCTKIIPLWSGGFPYGNPKSIEEYLVPKIINLSKQANTRVKMRVLQTGHGFGGNENCAEFCAKEHYIKVNGNQRYKNLVWKDNCGSNAIYPQPGTWLYDRSNWCPGEAVNPYDYWLEEFMVDGQNTIDMDMQPFTNINNNSNSYIISAYLFVYEENTASKADVALEEIIAPNRKNNFVRFNPTCGLPRVSVKNTSMVKTESITFKYGIKGGSQNTWTWTGEILPYETADIDLAFFDWSGASVGEFTVNIEGVNGTADANAFNNSRESGFELTPQYPEEIQIWFKANSKGNETTLAVHELDGRVIWSRSNFGPGESTRDTVRLVDGCYYFRVSDAKRNGFKFWAIPDGTGLLTLRHMTGLIFKNIDGDFGTDYVEYFTVGHPLGANEVHAVPEMRLYPNPTQGRITLEFTAKGSGSLRLMDMQGRIIENRAITETGLLQSDWDLSGFVPGIYMMEYQGPDGKVVEKVVVE